MKKNGWIPLDDKKRKQKTKWKYWLAVLAFLIVCYLVQRVNDERVLETAKEYLPTPESAISQLSLEETEHFYDLRDKVLEIYRKYLTEEEYIDWMAINQKNAEGTTTVTVDEFNKGRAYHNEVFSNATSEEKRLMNEFGRLILKLADLKK